MNNIYLFICWIVLLVDIFIYIFHRVKMENEVLWVHQYVLFSTSNKMRPNVMSTDAKYNNHFKWNIAA